MDGGAYRHPYLSLPTESLSGNSAIEVVSGPSSNAGQFLPQGPFLEDEGRQVNRWLLGIPLHALGPPVTEESYPADLYTPILSTLLGNDGMSPLDSMCCASVFPWFTESGYFHRAPSIDPASVNTTSGKYQEEISVSSPLPDLPRMPGIGPSRGQRAPEDNHQESQKTEKRRAVVSSRSFQQPNDMHGTRKSPHSCDVCGKGYSQPQGLKRHQRETHYVSLCMYCRDYRWGRRYRLRKHLEKKHTNVDVDAALNEATGARRGGTGHRGD